MSAIILIREFQGDQEVAVHRYGRDQQLLLNIDYMDDLAQMTVRPAQVYPTGLDAKQTVRRLRERLFLIAQKMGNNTRFEVVTDYFEPTRNPAGPGSVKVGRRGGKANKKYG